MPTNKERRDIGLKIKLLFVIMHLHMGGAERSLVNLLSEIDYSQYEVDLLLIKKEGDLIRQLPKEVHLLETPYELKAVYSNSIDGIRGVKYFLARGMSVVCSNIWSKIHTCDVTAIRWNQFYKRLIPQFEKKYDIAIAYLTGPSMYYVADKVNADKKIVFYHNDYFASNAMPNRPTDLPYFEKFDLIPTISDQCKQSLEKAFPDMKEKFTVVPNITSTKLIRLRADVFCPEEYKGKKNVICSIGRLNEQKGFDLAIQAAASLKKRGVSFNWYIIGEGEERKKLQELIANNQLEDCFFLLGIRDNPYPYLKNADVVVQPSRYEGKSMVLDEAKILAEPIVATNYTTVRDQLSDEEGLVVDMTPEEIAEGIQKMLTDSKMREGFVKYLQQRDYGNTDEMEKFYDALM